MPSGHTGRQLGPLVAALLESLENLVIATDSSGRILAWNSIAARTLGYGEEEALGQEFELLIPEDQRRAERAVRERVHQGEDIFRFETVRRAKVGRRVDLVLRLMPMHEEGRFCGVLEIGREKPSDIGTEAVSRTQSLLPLITDNLSVLISYVDPEMRYRLNNSAYERWFGLSREEIEGQSVADVVGTLAWTKIEPRLREAMTGRTVSFEEEVPYARGGTRWIRAVYAPHLASDGNVLGVAVLVDDITDHKRAEQTLADSDRRKDEFLAMLAHELRNPLAPLKTSLQIVCETSDPHARERACGIMNRQVAHLSRLVEDLLDVSRITRGIVELRTEPVELAEIVAGALEASGPLIAQRRHHLSVELPSSAVQLHADPVRLIQVFSNLLNNAAQYTEPEGTLALTAETRGDHAEVKIADTGIGMEAEVVAHIFELFARGERSLARAPGLGVGLSVVRRLVELHGGSVHAHSDGPGRGSAFTVRLPMRMEEAHASSPQRTDLARKDEARVRRRVLLIEDNRDARESLSILLRFRGYHIRFANDGATGVEVAARFQPDAILLDINLPGMDGYEVARAIREQSWGADLLLVATTGWGQRHDKDRAREAGFDFHLTKPFDLDLLDLMLQEGTQARRRLKDGM
jgi:PAS domain S-box-containing protein